MFAGVIDREAGEPWGTTGLTSATWRDIPVRMVMMEALIMTQKGIYFESILDPEEPYGGDPYPHVVVWQGKFYLEDGHHRVVRAALQGLKRISARVLVL